MKRTLIKALKEEGFGVDLLPNGNYDVTGYPLGDEHLVCDVIGCLIDTYDDTYDVECGGWDDEDGFITIFRKCYP